jgi:hypothetical protein
MQHPNHGQVATPRLRPSRAPKNPASEGAGGRVNHKRKPAVCSNVTTLPTLPVYLFAREGDGYPWPHNPAPVQLNWTGIITPTLRRRIENEVELRIAFLDALDAAGEDLEEEDGGCEVEDLRGEPSLGWAADGQLGDYHLACCDSEGGGDVDDEEDDPGECNGDLENAIAEDGNEPSDGNDIGGHDLTNAGWCPV